MTDWSDNPFAQQEDDNPFDDPSVTSAVAQDTSEYNPFDKPVQQTSPPASSSVVDGASAFQESQEVPSWAKPEPKPASPPPQPKPSSQPKPVTQEPSWANTNNSRPAPETQQQSSASATADEEAKIRQTAQTMREYEYAERERQARMTELAAQGRPPNFPNFPGWMRFWCFKPCFHVDIKTEIPLMAQRATRIAYYSWLLLVFCLFWNFVCCLATLAAKSVSGRNVSCALAALYFVLFTPCSYYCWFHQAYSALRKDASIQFGWFFLVMAFQFISSVFFAIGVPGTGAAGIWTGAEAMDSEDVVGILVFTNGGLWIVAALLHAYIIKRMLSIYRAKGITVDQMQREAAQGIAQNKTVRKVARDAVVSGVEESMK